MLEILLPLWVLSVACAAILGAARQRLAESLAFGLLFGPLGFLLVAFLPLSVAAEARRRRAVEREMDRQCAADRSPRAAAEPQRRRREHAAAPAAPAKPTSLK